MVNKILTEKNITIVLIVIVLYILFYFNINGSPQKNVTDKIVDEPIITEKQLINFNVIQNKDTLYLKDTLALIKVRSEEIKQEIFKGKKINPKSKKFIEDLIRVSLEEEYLLGISAPIKIAQAIIESGWGKDNIAVSHNNYFGIKNKQYYNEKEKKLVGAPVSLMTHEYDKNLKRYNTRANFISYETRWASIRHHSLFLEHQMNVSSRQGYRKLKNLNPRNYVAWALCLQDAGYATSPVYAAKLINIIRQYNLHKVKL